MNGADFRCGSMFLIPPPVPSSSGSCTSLSGRSRYVRFTNAFANCCGKRCVLMTKDSRSEEHTSELQSQSNLVCRLLLEKKKKIKTNNLHLKKIKKKTKQLK